jgi:hypothetical protein
MELKTIEVRATACPNDSTIIVVQRKFPKGISDEQIREFVKPEILLCLAEAKKLPHIDIQRI